MPYVAQQGLLENALPPNVLNYWKADFVASVNDGVIQNAVDAFATVASPMSSMLFFPIHGAARRVPVNAPAFQYAVAPDGQQFLMLSSDRGIRSGQRQLRVVRSWFEELKRVVPRE